MSNTTWQHGPACACAICNWKFRGGRKPLTTWQALLILVACLIAGVLVLDGAVYLYRATHCTTVVGTQVCQR